ncbi:Non-catalytic module family EXPN protein [Schizophyllum commune]
MYAATFVAALATLSAVQALPMNTWHHARKEKPSTYAEGYLEDYDTYHTRYLAIGCQNQHNTQFFDDCCHPMLATENLHDNRAAYCDPANISSSAAAPSSTAVEATSTSSSAAPAVTSGNTQVTDGDDDDDGDYEDCDDDEDEGGDEESSSQEAPASTSSSEQAAPTSTYEEPATTSQAPETTSQAPETTSTSESAPETTSTGGDSGSGSGSSGDLTGTATFFYQNGVAGSCGTVHSDNDYVAAMTPTEYGRSGDICGKSVHITNTKTGQSVDVIVADTCPTCTTGSDIDLSVAAFNAIGLENDGVEPISWHYN